MKVYLAAISVLVASLGVGCGGKSSDEAGAPADQGRKVLYYKSSMDPSFIATKPGKDSMGMDLVAVYEGDPAANLDVIEVSGAVIQQSGVRVEKVERQRLTRVVRALGRAQVDEGRVSTVNTKFDGWIEKLWVDETGQKVKQGDPLFAVYSPELVASQEEYLQIRKSTAAGPHSTHLLAAARQRLLQFDVPESFVRQIERSGEAQRRVVFRAPRSGFVIHKTAFQGTFVQKGASLFTIADLNALWVVADVYEFDAPWVFAGQKATIELDYLPGVMQEAKVDYVYPVLDEKTRTVQVRLVLPNPKVSLKPGMFATVRIHTEPAGETLVVPDEAVIHSGERSVAFVSLGQGRFEPRELSLGVWGDGFYQVLEGLEEGERVVTSGQFLLDSESRLKEAVKKLLGGNLAGATPKRDEATPEHDEKDHAGQDH
jgi:Cu(I)/Ag(I) efflux system membrane fusion protein/cobalt-zinc-cadmium efflux system membrane fusion protein